MREFHEPMTVLTALGTALGGAASVKSAFDKPKVASGMTPAQDEARQQKAREEAARKQRAEAASRTGRQASLLTGPALGTAGGPQPAGARKTLLGS